MMNDENGTETIALAMMVFEKGAYRILKKRRNNFESVPSTNDKKSRCRIQRLLDHLRFMLEQLHCKRQTLQSFLCFFEREWKRLEFKLEDFPVEILTYSLQNFVRCQDSFILLTSGECRHEYEQTMAKKTKYRSRLSTLQERDDGYTVLYKNDAYYSGYGFDEFNNELVGIRALLVKELKRYHKNPWDCIERHDGTELLESILDQHEREMKQCQDSLQSLKRKMIDNINKRLKPINLKFATQDKMERLSLTLNHGQNIVLERRANSFQIVGPLLPNDKKKPEDWNSYALDLGKQKNNTKGGLNKSRKRKRVIVDSDDDDGVTGKAGGVIEEKFSSCRAVDQVEQGSSSGILVRVDLSRNNTENEDSLTKIKNQMGINTNQLAESRIGLEGEGTTAVIRDRLIEEARVVRLEKILNRVLTRDEVNPDEVFDARECLRYACMDAGNIYLWDSRYICVDRAIQNFEKAQNIVELQKKSLQHSTCLSIQLNLLYLQGQAIVNIGIALVDTSERKMTTPKVKIYQAIDKFKEVQGLMVKLRDFARKSKLTTEAASYMLKSKQLESMACRWMGMGLWLISQEKKSIESFQQAALFLGERDLQNWYQNFTDDIFVLAAESIYATCDLADRCCSKMEKICGRSSTHKKGEYMLSVFNETLDRRTEISETIERVYGKDRSEEFREDYEITSADDVVKHRDAIIKWWKEESNRLKNNEKNNRQSVRPSHQRSELSSHKNIQIVSKATNNAIFSSDGKRKRYKIQKITSTRRGEQLNYKSKRGDALSALSKAPLNKVLRQSARTIKYRKWGDALAYKNAEVSGNQINEDASRLQYPSVAPPLPEELL